MFCLYCGHPIEEGDAFCEGCGQVIESPKYVACVHCGQLAEATDVYCEYCGNRIDGSTIGARQSHVPTSTQSHAPSPSQTHAPSASQTYAPSTLQLHATTSTQTHAPTSSQSHIKPYAQPRMLLVFLLDTSAAATTYIDQLISGFSRFIVDTCSDDIAKNALDIALIHFNDDYYVLEDLPNIANIGTGLSQLAIGGNANYSAPIREALHFVEEYSSSYESIYKPWVIMIASSGPSDDISIVAREVIDKHRNEQLRFIALGVSSYNDVALKQLTDVVLRQDGNDFSSFFEWASQCIKVIVNNKLGDKPRLPSLQGNIYRDR